MISPTKRAFLISSLSFMLLLMAFLSGYFLNRYINPSTEFSILGEAHRLLKNHALGDIPSDQALEYGMIRGMLEVYDDPHTVFIEPPQHEIQSNTLEGKYGGIGVELGRDADGFWMLYPHPDSPASLAGIMEYDRLFGVDDLIVNLETPGDTIISAIRGPIGQRVTIVIGRLPDYSPTLYHIKRQEIAVPSVTWHLEPQQLLLGIIDVNIIAANTPDEITKAVKDLQSRGATHFVLDLRDNPGGLLIAGIDIARLFLEEGTIIQQQYRGQEVETYQVEHPGPFTDIPLVVLINHGSASAAEIAAGALQVHKRCKLIGSPSFGKDTIQLVFELQDKSSLHVTAAKWWIPGLPYSLGERGLQPDILVDIAPDGEGTDPAIQEVINAFWGE